MQQHQRHASALPPPPLMRLRHRRSVLPPTVVRRRSGSSGAGTFAPAPSLAVPLAGLPVIGEAAAEAVGAALGGDGAPAAPQQQQQQQQQQDGGSPASADPPSSPFAQALSAPLPHDAPPPAIGSTGELARSSGHGLQLREPAGGSGEHSWKGFGSGGRRRWRRALTAGPQGQLVAPAVSPQVPAVAGLSHRRSGRQAGRRCICHWLAYCHRPARHIYTPRPTAMWPRCTRRRRLCRPAATGLQACAGLHQH